MKRPASSRFAGPLLRRTPECVAASRLWPPGEGQGPGPKGDRRVSIEVFQWKWFEKTIARAHPITPVFWFGPFIAASLVQIARGAGMSRLGGVGWFAFGWLIWSLIEYTLHRFLFHMSASTPEQRMRGFLVHGYHHEYPKDPMRLVAPPLMSWPIGLAIALGEYLAFGVHPWIFVYGGTAAGYLAYDWIHYYTHHFRPRNPVGRWLRNYHMLHHYQDGESRFGISSPLWDFVLRTHKPIPSAAREIAARDRVEVEATPVDWSTSKVRVAPLDR